MESTGEQIVIGSKVGQKNNCSVCQKEATLEELIRTENDKGESIYLCKACEQKISEALREETRNPNILMAIVGGAVGAVIGGIAWYVIAILTGLEIGYVALGLGYLIGLGVYLGAGKKRGQNLQFMSAALAVVTIFITENFIFQYFVNQYISENPSEFPDFVGTVSVPFFDPDFLGSLVSPIGLLIYGLGIYFAYKFCRARKSL